MTDPRWYAILTVPRSEAAADGELRRLGYWTFYPFIVAHRRRKRGNALIRVAVSEPYFPRYTFVCFRGEPHESYSEIEELDEVATMVRSGVDRRPLVIPEPVIVALKEAALVNFEDKPFGPSLMREIYHVDNGQELTMFLTNLGRRRIDRREAEE